MVKRNKEKTPQVAVIGCGYWGKNLVRNYHNLGALKLICDKNETALADFKSQYADIDTCIALADVLSRKDIAGVVISSPAETHFSIARESLLASNISDRKPVGWRLHIRPRLVEQDGVPRCGDPDMIKAQFGRQGIISCRCP